jgi:para-aminobenzoate synthetase / 4-amino-4-deoxychorismate lyase
LQHHTLPRGPWIQDADSGRWWHFGECREVISAARLDDVLPALRRLEERTERDGLWAAGFIAYDASPAFDPALRAQEGGDLPLLWFGLYDAPALTDLPGLGADTAPDYRWDSSIGRDRYDRAIAEIHRLIGAGDAYQVNYTFRLRAALPEPPDRLFLRMQASSGGRCGAYLDCGRFVVCSASPELFFRRAGRSLESRPMKGTAGRGLWPAQDAATGHALQASAKNRAENVMIVDMVRNDLGAVSVPGSVRVPALFSLERYPTVWQLTSTVRSETDAPLSDILAALFPAASITGAPKIRSSAIIADLETAPRGIYTGCIGWIAPARRAQFNVAIRTALVDRETATVEYGVGGGIVWDSIDSAEYDECRLKARLVTAAPQPRFSLLETLLWEPGAGYFLLDGHLQRIAASAARFGFACDEAAIRARLSQLAAGFPPLSRRVRLLVDRDGAIACEAAPVSAADGPVRLRFAAEPIDASDPFLYNKTTFRQVYERARAGLAGCDDVLMWNDCGEVTETTIANVVAEIGGERRTPPLSSGLLPGVFRAHLLDAGTIVEASLTRDDLRRATRLWTINSVRRWREARLLD